MKYQGSELDIFSHAKNWKDYYCKQLKDSIQGDVLEVGSGIGGSTLSLINENVDTWTSIEPDQELADTQKRNVALNTHRKINILCASIDDSNIQNMKFDTILYIDVLEHIKNDQEEILKAEKLMKPKGSLIILCPAHNFLFSPFDESVGHYKRYSKKDYLNFKFKNSKCTKCFYLDSIGFFASLVNKYFLKQPYPSKKQIAFWDNILISLSKVFDRLLFYKFGKTVVGTWVKNE